MFSNIPLFDRWINAIISDSITIFWGYPLLIVFSFGLVISLLTFLSLVADANAVSRANTYYQKGESPKDHLDDLSACVKEWALAIIGRSQQGHASGVNELEILFNHRYTKGIQWIDWLKGVATTIGLLFTFIGLGMALQQLSEALQSSNTQSLDLKIILNKIRDVLPAMGTAFASSIAGIIVSMLLGLFDSLLSLYRSNIGNHLAKLSLMWLEPGLLPMNDTSVFERVADAIISTKDMMAQNSKDAQAIYRHLEKLLTNIDQIPIENQKIWEFAISNLTELSLHSIEKQKEMTNDMKDYWNQTIGQFSNSLTDASKTSKTYSDKIKAISNVLDSTLKEMTDFTSSMSKDLTMSAEHISNLRHASEAFTIAQNESVSILQDSRFTQEAMLQRIDKTFQLIPMMTEAITQASASTANSAMSLEKVILNSKMEHYVEKIADLANLTSEEKLSREKMHQVIEYLTQFGSSLSDLKVHVSQIGRTSTALTQSYEHMSNQMDLIANQQMLPLINGILSEILKKSNDLSIEQQGRLFTQINQSISKQDITLKKLVEIQEKSHKEQVELVETIKNATGHDSSKTLFKTLLIIIAILLGLNVYQNYHHQNIPDKTTMKPMSSSVHIQEEDKVPQNTQELETSNQPDQIKNDTSINDLKTTKDIDTENQKIQEEVMTNGMEITIHDIEMIFVEGGKFELNMNRFLKKAEVKPFFMSKKEITFAEYEKCIKAGVCEKTSKDRNCAVTMINSKIPVNCISWENARKFANWVGGDLPSEVEWLYVVTSQGKKPNPYATTNCSTIHAKGCAKTPIILQEGCTLEQNEIDLGFCDLYGNVEEFLLDEFQKEVDFSNYPFCKTDDCGGNNHLARGGSFLDDATMLKLSHRSQVKKSDRSPKYGFRVKMPYPSTQLSK